MHEVLVNRLGGLSLPRKSVVRPTDRPDMTLDVYRGRKTTIQQRGHSSNIFIAEIKEFLIYEDLNEVYEKTQQGQTIFSSGSCLV